jgi:hypothetical protein
MRAIRIRFWSFRVTSLSDIIRIWTHKKCIVSLYAKFNPPINKTDSMYCPEGSELKRI